LVAATASVFLRPFPGNKVEAANLKSDVLQERRRVLLNEAKSQWRWV